ncbi:ABC-type transporter, integral membrane subunit [Gemmatirosa kalamazoonensis]|uniref:ABC-type transporter, integral membrane subunit n=1 Tax=Gemmatirosa kalamazoonensis TaxID=861299 RepID=W0RCI1_9BACT|nr:ABC transporter permease [Gemmatirosa kalamazoonensis]AHG88030.1 ABC-type transporter, integral membrane subunit [Gemmatirosa kalamazoonensis]
MTLARLLHRREAGTFAGLLLLSLVLWAATPYFATVDNLVNVLEQSAIVGVLSVGMTFVILTGGIDLSVGSLVALAGIAFGAASHAGLPTVLAVLAALVVGGASGLANGLLVSPGRLPPFIATLGTMSVARGAALMLTGGRPISGFPTSVRAIAHAEPLGIPAPVLLMLAVYAAAHVALTRTVLGRYVYAVGGNEVAAALSGVSVSAWKRVVYVLSGVASALTGVLLVARLDSAQPVAGLGYELDAIAAVVIGGASLMGGAGTVLGTLVGALLMTVLRNGLNLLSVSSYLQQVAIGLVIIAAVVVDMTLRRRSEKPTK